MHLANSRLKLPTDLFRLLPGGAEAPVSTEFWSPSALARVPPEPLDAPAAQPVVPSRSPASTAAAIPTGREDRIVGAVRISASSFHREFDGRAFPLLRKGFSGG
jgi:hypothetical protein